MRTVLRAAGAVLAVALLTSAWGSSGPAALAADGRGLRITGGAVRGASTPADAQRIEPGVRTDVLGGVGTAAQTRYYLVRRTTAGSTLHASVLTPQGDERDVISIALQQADGSTCASDTASSSSPASAAVLSASIATPSGLDASDAACAARGDFVLAVAHGYLGSGSTGRTVGVPVEVRVSEEAPVRSVEALPNALDTPVNRALGGAATAEVTGATTLPEATTLQPGAVRGRVAAGGVQVFAVRLEYGQSLAASASVSLTPALRRRFGRDPAVLALRLLSPSRADAAGGYEDDGESVADASRGASTLGAYADAATAYDYTGTVVYRNRFASAESDRAAAERGRYLVLVSLRSERGEAASYSLPFVLRTAVRGTVRGTPDYATTTAQDGTPLDTGQADPVTGPAGSLRLAAGSAFAVLAALAFAGAAVALVLSRRRRSALG